MIQWWVLTARKLSVLYQCMGKEIHSGVAAMQSGSSYLQQCMEQAGMTSSQVQGLGDWTLMQGAGSSVSARERT